MRKILSQTHSEFLRKLQLTTLCALFALSWVNQLWFVLFVTSIVILLSALILNENTQVVDLLKSKDHQIKALTKSMGAFVIVDKNHRIILKSDAFVALGDQYGFSRIPFVTEVLALGYTNDGTNSNDSEFYKKFLESVKAKLKIHVNIGNHLFTVYFCPSNCNDGLQFIEFKETAVEKPKVIEKVVELSESAPVAVEFEGTADVAQFATEVAGLKLRLKSNALGFSKTLATKYQYTPINEIAKQINSLGQYLTALSKHNFDQKLIGERDVTARTAINALSNRLNQYLMRLDQLEKDNTKHNKEFKHNHETVKQLLQEQALMEETIAVQENQLQSVQSSFDKLDSLDESAHEYLRAIEGKILKSVELSYRFASNAADIDRDSLVRITEELRESNSGLLTCLKLLQQDVLLNLKSMNESQALGDLSQNYKVVSNQLKRSTEILVNLQTQLELQDEKQEHGLKTLHQTKEAICLVKANAHELKSGSSVSQFDEVVIEQEGVKKQII